MVSSTFDEQYSRHVAVARMVIENQRLVNIKKMWSYCELITRLGKRMRGTKLGKVLTGKVDANALQDKRRAIEASNREDLTIISTLCRHRSRMDGAMFEEFKGTGNSN